MASGFGRSQSVNFKYTTLEEGEAKSNVCHTFADTLLEKQNVYNRIKIKAKKRMHTINELCLVAICVNIY